MLRTSCIIATGVWDGDRILFKNRDRAYIPKVRIVHDVVDGVEVLYMEDDTTGWIEGLNEFGLGMVNAALIVGHDELEHKIVKKGPKRTQDGDRALRALVKRTPAEAVKAIRSDARGLLGHTLIATKDEALSVEMVDKRSPVEKTLGDGVIVRTNHGIRLPDAGYTHGEDYLSSVARRDQAISTLEDIEDSMDIAPAVYGLRKKDRKSPNNMVRDTDKMRTTSQIVMNLNKRLLVLYLIPGKVEYLGYENRLPKGRKPKCKFEVLEYTDLDGDGDFDILDRKKKAAESLPGGKARTHRPSDFDPDQIERGIEVEQEHLEGGGYTKRERDDLAREIAMDHLTEIPDYYTRLDRMEEQAKKASSQAAQIALMKFLSRLAKRLGVEDHVYVVGGAVRNFVLQHPIKDIDVVVDSVALKGKDSEWFATQLGQAIPTNVNLTTNQYGVAILTVKGSWVLDGQEMQGEVIEIANARKESYGGGGKGYKPDEVVPATIEEDVLRREFSFNTLLWRLRDLTHGPDKAEILDLTGCGLRDLQEGNIRCPRDPDIVFSDDPTRMLRLIRFVNRYGFKVPPDVAASVRRNAGKMKHTPWEAIAKLFVNNILNEPTAPQAIRQMKSLGLLDVIAEMVTEQKPFSAYLARELRDRNVRLLLDLLDLGITDPTPLRFLTPAQQARLRRITTPMPSDEADAFASYLEKPPLNNPSLIQEYQLYAQQRALPIQLAREALLDNPSLMGDDMALDMAVRRRLDQQNLRMASDNPSPLSFQEGDAILYGKFQNKMGILRKLWVDERGVAMIEIEPFPKGRKKNRVMGLFRIRHANPATRVASRFLGGRR